jgi:hypothetical protein
MFGVCKFLRSSFVRWTLGHMFLTHVNKSTPLWSESRKNINFCEESCRKGKAVPLTGCGGP